MGKKKKKSNETKALTWIQDKNGVREIVKNTIKAKKGTKRHEYSLYRMFGLDTPTACDFTGYSLHSGYHLNWELKNNEQFQLSLGRFLADFPDKYRQICKLHLPQISKIEAKMLDKMEDDPELAIKHGGTALRQIKESAGALEPMGIKAPTININELRMLVTNSLEEKPIKLADIEKE